MSIDLEALLLFSISSTHTPSPPPIITSPHLPLILTLFLSCLIFYSPTRILFLCQPFRYPFPLHVLPRCILLRFHVHQGPVGGACLPRCHLHLRAGLSPPKTQTRAKWVPTSSSPPSPHPLLPFLFHHVLFQFHTFVRLTCFTFFFFFLNSIRH